MHARDLIELAALVTAHGPVLIGSDAPLPVGSIEQYWCSAKTRLDAWGRTLKDFTISAGADVAFARMSWPPTRAAIEEILTGEILTRVWTAVLVACDRGRGQEELTPVAKSVWAGHLEARHRVLSLLVSSPAIDTLEAVAINRLRRRTERWADMLLGVLESVHDVSEFAVDVERVREFSSDLHYREGLPGGRQVWPLVQSALRVAFQQGLAATSPNAATNGRIAAAIVGGFPPEVFDSTGLLRSLWHVRLENATDDAQGLVEDFLRNEPAEFIRHGPRGHGKRP